MTYRIIPCQGTDILLACRKLLQLRDFACLHALWNNQTR